MDNVLALLPFKTSFANFNASVMEFFKDQPWLHGIAVFLVTFMVASILTWLIFKILARLTRKTEIVLDDELIKIARAPVYYSLVITGFSTAIKIMPLTEQVTQIFLSGAKTIGVLIWMTALIKVAKIALKELSILNNRGHFIRPETVPLFDNLVRVLIIAAAIYITFQLWGIDMTAWLASAGIVGIAVGFAAKDTLSNLFSGVFILADTPYKIGDYVVIDDDRGKVTHIGIRSTRFLTRDDVEITVPNSIVGNSRIVNQSGGQHIKFRLRIKVGLAYGSNIDVARALLLSIAQAEPGVCQSPKPRVRFRSFGGSSLDHELLCWVNNPELRGRVTDSLNLTIYNRFLEENIEIPFAKQDLYIKELPERAL